MGNKAWNKQWKSYVDGLSALRWLPNHDDSERVHAIQLELKEIIDRNTK